MILPKLTIIIPTYNESETIGKAIIEISHVMRLTTIPFDIMVVDDNSPDGTGGIAISYKMMKYPVALVQRTYDKGLSQSVIEGFKRAEGDIIVVTDADMSHDINTIPKLYQSVVDGADIAIGSRYLNGGKIVDWPVKRRAISFGATFLSRLLFPDIKDPVSGFFAVRKDLVSKAILKPCGYKILLEVLGRTYWRTVKEIPYTFTDRKAGVSKLKTDTVFEFLSQFFDLAKTPRAQRELHHLYKFASVGAFGMLVNTVVLATMKEVVGLPLVAASVIAVETAIISNFAMNDNWTYRDIRKAGSHIPRLLMFNLVSLGGMFLNVSVLWLLASTGLYYLVANIIGIFAGFGWNFVVNRRTTWSLL